MKTGTLAGAALLATLLLSVEGLSMEGYDSDPTSRPEREPLRDVKRFAFESFVNDDSRWNLTPSALKELSGGAIAQGLCKIEMVSDERGMEGLTLFGKPVVESIVRIDENGKFKNVHLLIDFAEQKKSPEAVEEDLDRLAESFSELYGARGRESVFRFPNKRALNLLSWEGRIARAQLRWSFEPKHVQLSAFIERADLPDLPLERRFSVNRQIYMELYNEGEHEGRKRFVVIPMRHQLGETCYAATLTRQIDCLGSELDQEALELSLAGERNEDVAVEQLGRQLGFRAKKQVFYERGDAGENCLELMNRYNELAAEAGKPAIKSVDKNGIIFYGDNFKEMDRALLDRIPPASEEKFQRFKHVVAVCVNHGLPVSWTVARWQPKVKKEGGGRHRRTIIGYDMNEDAIFFSDSWGLRYDFEKMPMKAAFTMTIWMQSIVPVWEDSEELPQERERWRDR